jgi:hypothetical protein
MIPLRSNLPTRQKPVVTPLIIGINVYVYLKAILLGPWAGQRLILYYGLIPCSLSGNCDIAGRVFSPEVTLFTSMFVHAGFLHVAGNMLSLWIFGANVPRPALYAWPDGPNGGPVALLNPESCVGVVGGAVKRNLRSPERQRMIPFTCGTHYLGSPSLLNVSRGIGTWGPPMRLLANSEICLVTLEPAAQ